MLTEGLKQRLAEKRLSIGDAVGLLEKAKTNRPKTRQEIAREKEVEQARKRKAKQEAKRQADNHRQLSKEALEALTKDSVLTDSEFAFRPMPDKTRQAIVDMIRQFRAANRRAILGHFSVEACTTMKAMESRLVSALNAVRWEYGYSGAYMDGYVYITDGAVIEGWEMEAEDAGEMLADSYLDLDGSQFLAYAESQDELPDDFGVGSEEPLDAT